jgi:hypothetical protein
MQYNRKVMAAARNWAHGRGTWQQHLKDIAIYHVLLPSFFQFASNGFRWDDEDQIRAASIGNFNSLFALGDLIDGALDLITGEPWKTYHPTPFLSTWDEIVKFSDHMQKIKPSTVKELKGLPEEYKSEELVNKLIEISQDMPLNYLEMGKALKNLSVILGNFTGYPVAGVTSMGKGIYDVSTGADEGSTFKKALRILGWSDYALYDRDNKDIKEIEKLLNDTTQPTLKKIEDKAKQKDDESKKIGNILSK